MSYYDDPSFKSQYEKENLKIPLVNINDNDKQFLSNKELLKKEFVEIFNNYKISEIKSMMNIKENSSEDLKFDFLFNNQEYVTQDFFNRAKFFNDSSSTNLDANSLYVHYIDYIQKFYGSVIDKTALKNIYEEFSGSQNKNQISETECERLIYSKFRKFQINLKDLQDRKTFSQLLLGGYEVQENEINLRNFNSQKQVREKNKQNRVANLN